jgi:hypothetical protein
MVPCVFSVENEDGHHFMVKAFHDTSREMLWEARGR